MSDENQNRLAPSSEQRVLIVAGEASGDLHGAGLVSEMRKLDPGLQFAGIGGNRMQEAGVDLMAHVSDMAIIGIKEILPKLGFLRRTIRDLKKRMDAWKPDLVILIDYPDFNLNFVARAAKKRKIKIFYYISPQVWAWRKGRINQIKRLVDRMAVILPFEVDVYAQKGFVVDFVGHPLLDMVKTDLSRPAVRRMLRLDENRTTIGLLPGSRRAEIHKLLGDMLDAARIIKENIPDAQFVLPLAQTLDEEIVAAPIAAAGIPVRIVSGQAYNVMAALDLAIATSGTATLETGLMGVPTVIIYKVPQIEYWIGRMIISVRNIGLCNLIAGKTIMPELIQQDACGPTIAKEALAILQNEDRKRQIIDDLAKIRASLGSPGAASRAAAIACDLLHRETAGN
ncbi:MAG: lipid-A-disaccharide synthase [Smithellaceae bacterium]